MEPNMCTNVVIFSIINTLTINLIYGDEIIRYSDPTHCNSSEYFNGETLTCTFCNPKLFLVPDLKKQQCTCNEISKPSYNNLMSGPICSKCPTNHIFSEELKLCIKCVKGSFQKYNMTCKLCKPNEIIVYQSINGLPLQQTQCIECKNGMVPSNDKKKCTPCPILNPIVVNGIIKCLCDYKSVLLENMCVSSDLYPEISNSKNKYFLQQNSGQKIESDLFEKYLKINIYLCKLKNDTACQFLANLCTLTLFSNYENSPCGLWLESRFSVNANSVTYLPWLFYREGNADEVLNRKQISAKYSLDSHSSMSLLNFTATVFYLNGTLKKVSRLQGSDLNLCPGPNHIKNKALRFGNSFKYTCEINADQLFDTRDTEFLVPYLHYSENGQSQLYAIPVLIRNIGNHNNGNDKVNWLLVRRFFILDKISSIASGKPSILQYLKSMEIRIRVQNNGDNGMIFPPLLILDYGKITQEQYESKVKLPFQISIHYEMDSNMVRSIEIAIGVLSTIAAFYSGLQTWTYVRRSGKVSVDLTTLFKFLLFSCGNLANAFFIVAFGASVHTFIFYKGQSVVHLLLPTSGIEKTIQNYIIVAFSLKLVEVAVLLWNQVTVDIFLIDWERPRPQETIPRTSTSLKTFDPAVSVWRSLFIANEWNEIQTKRRCNNLLHMILLTFILQVLGVEFWGTADPDLHLRVPENLSKTPFSFVCRFATGALVYVTLYILQIILVMGIYERYIKNAIHEFIDICSLANISIFIMSMERYGFYIHGRSSHGFSDTDMSTMIKQLKREEDDLCGYRGLLPGTYQQTFTVGMPAKLRMYYNKLMATSSRSIIKRNSNEPLSSKKNKLDDIDSVVMAYHNINRFFCAFLEHALKDLDYDVKDKSFFESLLDIEFTDCYDRGVLYMDNGHSFDNVLFYGNEFTLVSFDLILYSFILMLSDNFILSALLTISVAEGLKIARRFGGKRNLASKTLIDNRFLI